MQQVFSKGMVCLCCFFFIKSFIYKKIYTHVSVGAEVPFRCKKGEFDRCFNQLDQPVEKSRPDRQPDRQPDWPVDPTSFHLWSSSSSCLPSLVNATPRYLNFSTCFSGAPFTCNTHWSGFLERWSTSVLAVLIFIPAASHASAKLFNACRRPDSVEESRTKSSAKQQTTNFAIPNRGILISWAAFVDPIHVNNEKER